MKGLKISRWQMVYYPRRPLNGGPPVEGEPVVVPRSDVRAAEEALRSRPDRLELLAPGGGAADETTRHVMALLHHLQAMEKYKNVRIEAIEL